MNAASQAWKDIRYLAGLMRGIIALEDELAKVGSVEKLIAEKEAKLAVLDRTATERAEDIAAAGAKLADVQRAVKAAEAEAKAIVARGEKDANALRSKGAADAAAKVQEGDNYIAQARVRAEAVVTAAETEAADWRASLASLRAEIESALQVRDAANQEAATTQAALAEVRAEADALRKRLG